MRPHGYSRSPRRLDDTSRPQQAHFTEGSSPCESDQSMRALTRGGSSTPAPPPGTLLARWGWPPHLALLLLLLSLHPGGTGGADIVPLPPRRNRASLGRPTRCEPVVIPICSRGAVPWNATRLPNLLLHRTQEDADAALQAFRPLLQANCSDLLPLFLCSIYAPACPGNSLSSQPVSYLSLSSPPRIPEAVSVQQQQQQQQQQQHEQQQNQQEGGGEGAALPPCRDLCLTVKRSCAVALRKFRLSWPDAADCHRLPAASPTSAAGVCTASPSLPAESERFSRHSTHSVINSLPDCKCKKERKLGKKLYMANSYDYAMRGTYLSVQGIKGGPLVVAVRVEEVLKVSQVQIPNNTADLTLWVGKGCVCPRLKPGQQYIFLGYEDAENKRLLFGRKGVAMPWKDAWRKLVAKWEFRLQRKMARERRRQKWKSKIFERRPLPPQDIKTHRRRGRDRSHRTRGRHERHRRLWPGSM